MWTWMERMFPATQVVLQPERKAAYNTSNTRFPKASQPSQLMCSVRTQFWTRFALLLTINMWALHDVDRGWLYWTHSDETVWQDQIQQDSMRHFSHIQASWTWIPVSQLLTDSSSWSRHFCHLSLSLNIWIQFCLVYRPPTVLGRT